MTTATLQTPTVTPVELNLSDRCDRCSAQAFVRAVFPSGELLFCGHHYTRWQETIETDALSVSDERHKINHKPSVSANAD